MSETRAIPFALVGHYTFGIDHYFVKHEGEAPPGDLEIFRADAEHTRDLAAAQGELDDLRLAIDFLLAHSEVYLEQHHDLTLAEIINSENYQPEDVLKSILSFYRQVMWPDADRVPMDGSLDVEMVRMPLREWRDRRR